MKLLGRISLLLIGLIAFATITLWILAKNIKPETIQQLINNQITAITHKPSHINGDISWQLFPRPGLKFNKIQIGDEALNKDYTFTVNTLLLNLKITPLLRGNFVFSEININGLNVKINLDSPHVETNPQPNEKIKSSDTKSQFAIEKLIINDGQITLTRNNKNTILKNIQVGMEQFNLNNNPFPVQIKARLIQSPYSEQTKASINFKGRINLAPGIFNNWDNDVFHSAVDGQLLVQNISYDQLRIKKINATIKTLDNAIRFKPLTLSMYEGESVGDMTYSLATQILSINQTATNLDGSKLMAALIGNDVINGTLDYSLHVNLPLAEPSTKSVNGKGSITMKDGALSHVNLDQLLVQIKERLSQVLSGKKLDINDISQLGNWSQNKFNEGNTPFKLASVLFELADAKMNSTSLLLQTNTLQVTGTGTINLLNHQLFSSLQATINSNNPDTMLQKIQHALGGNFPLLISGTIEQPLITPNLKIMNPLLSKLLIKTTLDKPLKELESQLKGLIH